MRVYSSLVTSPPIKGVKACRRREIRNQTREPEGDKEEEDVKNRHSTMVEATHTAIAQIRKQVEENCEHVGTKFAEEARKIHYGETEKRGIYGEASLKETAELIDEGIDVQALPWLDESKKN